MKQPLDLNVASLISKSLISNNHYRKALPYLDKVIEWNPNDTDALYNKGNDIVNDSNLSLEASNGVLLEGVVPRP